MKNYKDTVRIEGGIKNLKALFDPAFCFCFSLCTFSHRHERLKINFFLQSEKSWDSRTDLIPSLYVFECVELELALKLASGEEDPFDSDFSCPIKLHKGKVFFSITVYILFILY